MTEPIIRKLRIEDLQNGFLTSLDSLRKASDIDKSKAEEIFKKIDSTINYQNSKSSKFVKLNLKFKV